MWLAGVAEYKLIVVAFAIEHLADPVIPLATRAVGVACAVDPIHVAIYDRPISEVFASAVPADAGLWESHILERMMSGV